MDSFSHHKPDGAHPEKKDQQSHHQPSSAELLNSAKVVAGAASSAMRKDTSSIDKAQVASAAEDLLGAASRYGKLEDKSFGKYIDQAENYLHKYHSSQSATAESGGHTGGAHSGGITGTDHSAAHGGGGKGEGEGEGHSSGGGYGDYIKMAQGFMKK